MTQPAHVLVVDDDADQRAIISHLIRSEGWTVAEAGSGEEALRVVRDESPDLVMLDVSMPRQSGFSVCEDLVRAYDGARMPHIIFVSGQTETHDCVRGLELGAVDYVTKPFVPEDLLARARVAIRMKARLDALAADAARDPLTGLWNRRHLCTRGRELAAVARRHQLGLSCLMLDIDHFKCVNDRFGHQVGDIVLRAVADRLRAAVRESDLLFRYGGEEFAVLATQADTARTWGLAERLRAMVAAQPISIPREHGEHDGVWTSISVGVATGAPGEAIGSLLHKADVALYHSKHTGRNRTTAWRPELSGPGGTIAGTTVAEAARDSG